jgi:hypothetical protein
MSIVPFSYGYDSLYCGGVTPYYGATTWGTTWGSVYPSYGYGAAYPATTVGYGYAPYSRRQARHLRKAGVYPYAW